MSKSSTPRPPRPRVASPVRSRPTWHCGGVVTWRPDILPGYEALQLPLPNVAPAAGEPAGSELCATLVRRNPARCNTALLYLHGWNDYFFQTHLAERTADLGFDFYALDLRRYGRSLQEGQLRGYVADLDEYDAELGTATDLIGTEHDSLVLMGHSTGGLVASLWAARHPDRVDALVLNSPWLDLQGSALLLTLGTQVIDRLGSRKPTAAVPLPDLGHYVRSVHVAQGGEWDYDLGLKLSPSPPIRIGWLRAIRRGHARVSAGLRLPMPVLVLLSSASTFSRTWHEGLRQADTVLDVELTARRAVQLGRHVTVVRIAGALHDVLLSALPAREQALTDVARWLSAYGPQPVTGRPCRPRQARAPQH